ncbi:Two-component sensor histidine kinase, contains HisKA and HATPase domains [Chitinophaga sp. YR573]|uniref:tetratricopeptide repeat-containing sensor histidine kinase n=1 Tax=Chitinophaga sp. YR573 TaxID=1881040 RepID=UPI0008D89264|nr:histidine kinase dimerization/phosphoacceptor domain -containing protein [Chitinophaga sp. YR573]SEW45536.1 Two-component sensor histidine kinase, contains HisKA and HATPase domains [Chitinophaga sp. YR573]
MKKSLKLLLYTFLMAGIVISAKAQQDTSRVNVLLQLSDQYFLKDNRKKSDLDSATLYVLAALKLSNTLFYQKGIGNSYEQLSKIVHVNGDSTKGRYFSSKAIDIFKANNYLMELGDAYFDLAGYYSFSGNGLTERIHAMKLSLNAFQKAKSRKKEADIFKELGDLYQIQGDFSKSLESLKQALKIYQQIGYLRLMGVYDLLGFVSTASGDQKEGIRYGLLALQTAEMVGDSSKQICTIYNRLGITYLNLNEFDKANTYFQKALSVAKKYKDNNAVHELAFNITHVLLRQGKTIDALHFLHEIEKEYNAEDVISRIRIVSGFTAIYAKLNNYAVAQKYCTQLLNISEKYELNSEENSLLYGAVIPVLLATHKYPETRKYLKLTEKTGLLMNLALNHLWWFKLDSTQGNYISAIAHYQFYKTLNDSLFNESKSRQVSQLEIVYNIEQKDKDLAFKEQNIQLLTKQAQLQNSRLRASRVIKNFTLSGIVLLLIIIILLYKHTQHRARSHKLLQAQQVEIQKKNASLEDLIKEKDWLVKEIHHRVKNNFHMVIGLLGTQSGYLKTEEALMAISDSQHRIHAMSLIHQKLYQSDNLSAINIPDYIHELVDYLRDSFNIRQAIQFKLYIDRIELDLSHCIPLGLILNEAITNAIKYAFPDSREGIITISLSQVSEHKILLTITDNGVGLPAAFDIHARNSMGMNLMQGLSEDMDGDFNIFNHDGTSISIAFDLTLTN